MIELSGNITLVGFKVLGEGELIVVKKMIGSYAQKFSDLVPGFERLTINLKPVHKHKGPEGFEGGMFELDAKALVRGKMFVSEVVDRNLFVGIDAVLSKLYREAERQVQKQKDIDKPF